MAPRRDRKFLVPCVVHYIIVFSRVVQEYCGSVKVLRTFCIVLYLVPVCAGGFVLVRVFGSAGLVPVRIRYGCVIGDRCMCYLVPGMCWPLFLRGMRWFLKCGTPPDGYLDLMFSCCCSECVDF